MWPTFVLTNDCMIEDPANVKCCMFTECRKDSVFGHCMNKAGDACSGGKWYKCVFPTLPRPFSIKTDISQQGSVPR
jgi:hypothetical protein